MGIGDTTLPRQPRAPSVGGDGSNYGSEGAAGGGSSLSRHYDQIIDSLNRLPRPVLILLTVALFAYAVFDPSGFSARMEALSRVPEPLWWMQGAVVTFYFGAREAHYLRKAKLPKAASQKTP